MDLKRLHVGITMASQPETFCNETVFRLRTTTGSLEKIRCSVTILMSETVSSGVLLAREVTRLEETVGLSIETVKRD